MSELRPVPTDPAALQAWIASLPSDQRSALTGQVASGTFTSQLASLDSLDPRNDAIELAPPPGEASLLTLSIELEGTTPTIWRRLALPGDLTLDAVHPLLQAAMGWTDSHLHRFQPGAELSYDAPYFVTEFDEDEGDEGTRETGVRLDQVLCAPGDQLTYLYDFGDGWEHRVTLESVTPLAPGDREPVCLGGERACPPEDVGGIPGYQEIADWLRAGGRDDDVPDTFEGVDHARGWLPVGYDPDAFDPAEATTAMQVWGRGEHVPWHGVPQPLAYLVQGLRSEGWEPATAWLTALGPRRAVGLDARDVRRAARPWLAVLDAVGAGTKLTTAGYLPPVVVGQIARAAGVTDWWIGQANREDLTWPVANLRQHAQNLGLLRKAKGTVSPTARARAARDHSGRLVAAVLERLPVGTGFEADAGWFLLLGMAAGESGADLDAKVGQMLTDRGWRTRDRSGVKAGVDADVSATEAHRGSRPTRDVLEAMAGGHRSVDPALLTRLARATLLGLTTS